MYSHSQNRLDQQTYDVYFLAPLPGPQCEYIIEQAAFN
jgi:hypothetical protein